MLLNFHPSSWVHHSYQVLVMVVVGSMRYGYLPNPLI
jgi:hypothetical protein